MTVNPNIIWFSARSALALPSAVGCGPHRDTAVPATETPCSPGSPNRPCVDPPAGLTQ
jgi:hypothetical protein